MEKGKKLGLSSEERDGQIRLAKQSMWKGQCGDAYWRGLSLRHLRHAVYENLIAAENEADKVARGDQKFIEVRAVDFDKDGSDEILVSNNLLNCYFSPSRGGCLFELDYKPANFNLSDGRLSLQDHFMPVNAQLSDLMNVKYKELGDFVTGPFTVMVKKTGSEIELKLKRKGGVHTGEKVLPVEILKTVSILKGQSLININYEITNLSPELLDAVFGVEFNFSMLAGDAEPAGAGELEGCSSLKIVDEQKGFSVSLETGCLDRIWRFPIETVSRSEARLETVYQSSLVFPNKRIILEPGAKWANSLKLLIE